MSNTEHKRLVKDARRSLRKLNDYYNLEFDKDNKSNFDKIFCTEYFKLEQIAHSCIDNLKSVNFYDEIFFDKFERLKSEIVNREFCIDTESLDSILTSMSNITINFFYNISNLIILIILSDIYVNITTELYDENRLSTCLTLLNTVGEIDFDSLAEKHVIVEQILKSDPTGDYSMQSEETCAYYRYMVSEIANKLNSSEHDIAQNILNDAINEKKHIGFSLYKKYLQLFDNKLKKILYIILTPILSVISAFIVSLLMNNFYLIILFVFPFYKILEPITHFFIQRGVKLLYPCRMNFKNRIPANCKSCVVLSTIITDNEMTDELEEKVEYILLSNSSKNINVVILADYKESKLPINETSKSAIISLDTVVKRLNKHYDNRVLLLVRTPEFSKTQQKFIGKNRKQGAIAHLVNEIKTGDACFNHICGDRTRLKGSKYLMLLDYDTTLQIDSVYDLVCVAAHPLNRPIIDKSHQVISGYGIINPQISLDLKSSLKNRFTSIIGGIGGISSYKENAVELGQSLFGGSIFTGKGLVDIDAYYTVMRDKFQDETVLSHDILEGIFLKTLHISDIELLDNFPENMSNFLKRANRWIRGDIQNIPYIFRKISLYDKFKLCENIRRAITPIFSILLLLNSSIVLRLFGVLFILSPYLFSIIIHLVKGYITPFTSQTFTNTLPSVWGDLLKGFYELVLIPQIAFTSFTAFVTALYRRFVSKRKMLEWTTSYQVSGDSNKNKLDIVSHLPNLISSLIVFANGGIVLGIVFIISYPLLIFSQKRLSQSYSPSDFERNKLINDAVKMMRYYRDNICEKNNYLPPDSIQFSPVYKVCDRTSPTNIGMMLLSFLSAFDLKIISKDIMLFYVTRVIETIERLEKYHGNLYNWYDIYTLKKLPNYFVSTVDSGNLLCCLVALKQGLTQYNCDISLIKRIEKIINDADLSVFFDNKKKLFSIGYDSENGQLSKSHYDMLMSEARMTSYFAIARGCVPKEHWEALSRTLSRQDNYTGAISWTGTMFEYFMPELLLHSTRGSLSYESLHYCIFCQKNRVKWFDIPYGISESAIYSFDSELNYQYNPNGVQRLALKSEQNKNLVVSPYSSYLTLALDFKSAYENLLLYENYSGKYGYYECIDYTESRVGRGNFRIVHSYMAHHIGMSMISIANALCNNVMQKRFLSDKLMCRARTLLQEKTKIGEILLFKQIKREEAKSFMLNVENEEYFGELHPLNPRVKLLNNGEISLALCDIGVSGIIKNDVNVTRHTNDILKNPLGTFCFINTSEGAMSLQYAPRYDEDILYESSMTSSKVNYYAKGRGIKSKITVSLCQSTPAEIRDINIKNDTGELLDTSLLAFLEPCLQSNDDYNSHKAFSKLFLSVVYDEQSKTLIVNRRQRDNKKSIYMAVGLTDNIDFDTITNRELLFERNNIDTVKLLAFTDNISNIKSATDQIVCFRIKIKLNKNEYFQTKIITAIGNSKNEAITNFEKAKIEQNFAAEQLKKNSLVARITQTLLPQVLYDKYDSSKVMSAKSTNTLGIESLNKFSIGTELPIVLVELYSENSVDRISGYLECYYHLLVSGIRFKLVFLCEGDSELVQSSLGKLSSEFGKTIISIEKSQISEQEANLLAAVACHIATRTLIRIETPLVKYKPVRLKQVDILSYKFDENSLSIENGVFSGDSFFVTKSPMIPWCHILANATFGTLLSDKSLGFTWAINSRQNKLTPWSNDTLMDNIGEILVAKVGENYYNLIDGALAEFNPQYAKFHCKFNDYTCRTTVSIPAKGMIKYIDIELENTSKNNNSLEISYFNDVVLGVDKINSRLIKFLNEDNIVIAQNPSQFGNRCFMGVTPYCHNFNFTCDRADYYTGSWNRNNTLYQNDGCIAISKKLDFSSGETKKIRFAVIFSATIEGLKSLAKISPDFSYSTHRKIAVETSHSYVDYMVNTWLPHQIVAGRIFGRTAFYQCGGAYGFRDQLQDVSIYSMLEPSIAKSHIIRCCASQFEEGDVLHWWHQLPSVKNGVRSRYSDDLVWLPYTVCEYIKTTGDFEITSIMVKYLTAPELTANEKDRYMQVEVGNVKESVYNHCKRALRRAYNISDNGLVKIGAGDWNDGYSNVGIKGIGQSVWLSQFLSLTLRRFSRIASRMDDKAMQDECIERATKLLESVDAVAYDDNHYIRAIYDNGELMGANSSDECKLDSLPQSFACLSDMRDEKKVLTSLLTAYNLLVDKKHGIIRLFYPPFANSSQEPGYVKAYPKGVRENGGQYTHAAIWFAMAMKKIGKLDEFFEMTRMLNPIVKYLDSATANEYMLEPYYIAADIYTNEDAYGRGGWSIYTGSAAWYYKLLVCDLLGINIENGNISFSPTLPNDMTEYKAFIKDGDEQIDYTNS